jgi:hypothetical protein
VVLAPKRQKKRMIVAGAITGGSSYRPILDLPPGRSRERKLVITAWSAPQQS